MFDGITCVYKSNIDLFFYIFGDQNENEVSFIFYFFVYALATSDTIFSNFHTLFQI